MTHYQKEDLLHRKIEDRCFVVNQKKGTLIDLNKVSFFLWKQLVKPLKNTSLIKILIKEYDVERKQAIKDVNSFLKKAIKSGIIKKIK